jgi:glutaredoxin 2
MPLPEQFDFDLSAAPSGASNPRPDYTVRYYYMHFIDFQTMERALKEEFSHKEEAASRMQQDLQTKNQMVLALQRTVREMEMRVQQHVENNERLKEIVSFSLILPLNLSLEQSSKSTYSST